MDSMPEAEVVKERVASAWMDSNSCAVSALPLIWFTKSTRAGHLSAENKMHTHGDCLAENKTHTVRNSKSLSRGGLFKDIQGDVGGEMIQYKGHSESKPPNKERDPFYTNHLLPSYSPLSVMVSRAAMALMADLFSSSCFSNSCFTELALALD